MAFLNDVTEKISKAGQGVAQSTKNLAATARLNAAIAEEEKTIKGCYTKIGEAYYLANNENPDDNLREWVVAISESLEKISDFKEQLQKIKGIGVCPSCGEEVPADSAFCAHCGAKIEQE